jgi:hypothetical protein
MTTKKSTPSPADVDVRGKSNEIEDRKRRREEATTVDGTESAQLEDSEAVKAQEAATATGGYGTGSGTEAKKSK